VVTFRGHRVEQTLIRCHFSPQGSTDGRYVYSGSRDGNIFIWNMDATERARLDLTTSSQFLKARDRVADPYWGNPSGSFNTVIRDCSWHPEAPIIAATAWNGWGASVGTCSIHSWKEGPMEEETEARIFDDKLRPMRPARERSRRRRMW